MAFRKSSRSSAKPTAGRWGKRGSAAATIAARLSLRHVGRHYAGVPVVEDVSLEVEPGEILCLLGPSGCGKTTLLRLVAGVERPSSGRILINDQEVAGPHAFVPPERRGVGLMFQDFALFPHLTIIQNVAFGLNGLGRAAALREAHAALERVGLDQYAEDYPHILSGGEQQRVALARAITPRPSVLLMDEPFSGLDALLRVAMREETLAILKETRATCMIVTHAPEEAMQLGNRIALMRKGRLIQTGTAEELYRRPFDIEVARMFSDLNEIACEVKGGKARTGLGVFAANGAGEGAAVACVRYSDVRVGPPAKGLSGRVLSRRFLGEAALLEIGVEGLEEPLFARVREGEAAAPGSEIGVTIERAGVLVFEAGDGGEGAA